MSRRAALAGAVALSLVADAQRSSPPPPLISLGPEVVSGYPTPHPYQFPDSAFPVLPAGDGSGRRLVFWADGSTYRVVGDATPSSPFPTPPPTPLTPVLMASADPTAYDANGNWLLSVSRLSNGTLVGFSHTENHQFPCGSEYGEWNFGAVVASDDDGVTWRKLGLAVADPQPCKPSFGGAGYSSILPHPEGGYIAWGGCSAYRSTDPAGVPGTWLRWLNGSFSSPGVGGQQDCLPGVSPAACCPIVHYNTAVRAYVMVWTSWGTNDTFHVATSTDGVEWGPSEVLLSVPSPRAIAYGQVIGDTDSASAGGTATLAYAAAPPTSGYPRDFMYRNITFHMGTERGVVRRDHPPTQGEAGGAGEEADAA